MSTPNIFHTENPTRVSLKDLIALQGHARRLALPSRRIFSQQSGQDYSTFKGRGMEYDSSRHYQTGDDARDIDWRVTARTGKMYTKLFKQEREKPVFLWIDYRRPMFFATRGQFKSVLATQFATLVVWHTVFRGDRIGGVLFSDTHTDLLKPQRGRQTALFFLKKMVRQISTQAYANATHHDEMTTNSLINLRRVANSGSLIFLCSDFRSLNDAARAQIVYLSRHNEIVLVFIYDSIEKSLPPPGRYCLQNGEQRIEIDTEDTKLQKRYQKQFAHREDKLKELARQKNLGYLPCRTTDDPLHLLKSGLGKW